MNKSGFRFEPLESRMFLSVTPPVEPVAPPAPGPITTIPPTANTGVILHLTAGVPFSGKVGFYASPVVDPPDVVTASINWGDGTTSVGTVQYGDQNKVGGYNISGAHNYAKAGTYAIVTTVILRPTATGGGPTPDFVVLAATIKSKAIVAARPANSPGGVTITELAGKSFTAVVGNFTFIAPGTGLHAQIRWGDGSTSDGVIKSTGVEGIDVIKFSVTGTHAYALPGTYPIEVVVTRSLPSPAASTNVALVPVATIHSTAEVHSKTSVTGKISGVYTVSSVNPDTGKTYKFSGAGTAGDLGSVTATGTVSLPGFIANGHAMGTLTLSNSKGSVTLTLTGTIETGPSAFPATLSFVIASATGAYASATGGGKIAVELGSKLATAVPSFTFTITSAS